MDEISTIVPQATGDQPPECRVVINFEDQYSIWPGHKPLPPGWRDAGMAGSREACLKHVETVWTDMRPKSLRDSATKKP